MPKRHRPGASAASVLGHVEEIVLATSGEDAFELVFSVAAGRICAVGAKPSSIARAVATAARTHRDLAIAEVSGASPELLAKVDALLARALPKGDARLEALDAIFESLVPRVAKSDKGQFFTPRHVVDFVVRALAPAKGETVVDPACGSGAFLAHARALADVHAYGCDVDLRAVRVARLLALASGGRTDTIRRGDGLREDVLPIADVVATNPPFAGRAPADGFDVARTVRTPERDVLFLERALTLLRPGGRLGIVLPYNKASGGAFAGVRRWLVERARVLAIVGLPRETFLPHTSQRTFVLFAQKRTKHEKPDGRERTMFLLSERAGKDTAGEPIFRGDVLDHDLADVAAALSTFFAAERFG